MTLRATLGEGNTPLIASSHIGPLLGLSGLFFKLEICNPSGSYKDRFIAREVSAMLGLGVRACIATSSGNTGSSLACYCARYGIPCTIVVNEQTPSAKLLQMQAHGARILRVTGFGVSPAVTENVLSLLSEFTGQFQAHLVVSAYRYCPAGMAGVETISEEMWGQCRSVINHVFVPTGGGGLFVAVCRGFLRTSGSKPHVHAVQPRGCSPLVSAFELGADHVLPTQSTTQISGLSVPFDIDGTSVLRHLRELGGLGLAVSDEEIWDAQSLLWEREGIYCEPAGAAALAGLCRAVHLGAISPNDTVICLVTGHGFKDPDSAHRAAAQRVPILIHENQLKDSLLKAVSPCG